MPMTRCCSVVVDFVAALKHATASSHHEYRPSQVEKTCDIGLRGLEGLEASWRLIMTCFEEQNRL